jgi:hypothetical protein
MPAFFAASCVLLPATGTPFLSATTGRPMPNAWIERTRASDPRSVPRLALSERRHCRPARSRQWT